MVDLRSELSGPNIRRLRAPVSGSMYLLALARELTARIEPRLSDSRDSHVLALCRKVLVRMAYADSISLDPDGTAPREIPPAVGVYRAQIREDIRRLEDLGMDAAVEIAEREGRLLDAAEAQVQGDLARLAALHVAGDELRVDPQAIRDYLARRKGESDRLDLASFEVAPGGYSKQTLLIGVAESRLLPDTFVIRKDHPAAIMQTSVCNEYPVLVQLYEAGLQVPQPLFLEPSGEYLGAPFMAVARLPGRVEGAHLVAPADHGLALQLATQLGRLHALECSRFAGLLPAPPSQAPDVLRSEIELLRRYWHEFAHAESATLEVAFAWLDENVDGVVPRQAVLHGDIGFHNLLIEKGRITAILDWELARFGHPAEDLGYCRSTVSRMVPYPDFCKTYEAAGGPHIDPRTNDFYTLLQLCRFVVYEVRGRGLFEFGATEDFGMAYIGAHELPALVHRLSEMLRDVLGRRGSSP